MRLLIVCSAVVVVGLGAWSAPLWNKSDNEQQKFLQDGRQFEKREIEFLLGQLAEEGISNVKTTGGKVQVPAKHIARCNKIVNSSEFSKLQDKTGSGSSGFSNPFLTHSEKERIAAEKKLEQLKDTLARLAGIDDVVIFYDQEKSHGFKRSNFQTAAVMLWADEGSVISESQAATVRRMICRVYAGMQEENVFVVDGDTGANFGVNGNLNEVANNFLSEQELKAAKKQVEIECRKILTRFGDPEILVRMDLQERLVETPASPEKKQKRQRPREQTSAVVANGTGSIKKSSPDDTDLEPAEAQVQTQTIKRLLGIDVSFSRQAINQYVMQNLGNDQNITEKQFSRGLVSLQNEITREVLRWLRTQKHIESGPDLVSVIVSQDAVEESATASATAGTDWNRYLVPAVATLGFVIAVFLLAISWKKRASVQNQSANNQFSGGGRVFVNRNQPNNSHELAEEANDVVQSAPDSSARAFQNLVAGENLP